MPNLADACVIAVDLTRQLSAARSETAAYRLLVQQALARLHEQHLELTRLRASHERLLSEYRAYRAATICRPVAA